MVDILINVYTQTVTSLAIDDTTSPIVAQSIIYWKKAHSSHIQ